MSYSCCDFTDDVCGALGVALPDDIEGDDNVDVLSELACAEIERLQRFKPKSLRREDCARAALEHLRAAYRLLAGSPKSRERVRLAITSTGGAIRHAQGLEVRQAGKIDNWLDALSEGDNG